MTDVDLFPDAKGNRAHYQGDVADAVMSTRKPFGPDLFGALYTPVDATYDLESDRTAVQFRPIPESARRRGEPMPGELPPMTRQQRRQLEREGRKAARHQRARR